MKRAPAAVLGRPPEVRICTCVISGNLQGRGDGVVLSKAKARDLYKLSYLTSHPTTTVSVGIPETHTIIGPLRFLPFSILDLRNRPPSQLFVTIFVVNTGYGTDHACFKA